MERVTPARRTSSCRAARTPEWENQSVYRDKYRHLMISEVSLATVAKFPWAHLLRTGNSVKIQQDGAKSHIEEATKNGCRPWKRWE